MPVNTYFRGSTPIPHGLRNKDGWVSGGGLIDVSGGYDRVTKPDNRPRKPKPLSDTDMTVERVYRNTATYNYPPGASVWWVGPAAYVDTAYEYRASGSKQSVDQVATANVAKLGRGSIDVGQFLGESKSTVGMIANRALQIAEAAKHLRNGNLRGIQDVLKHDLTLKQRAVVDGHLKGGLQGKDLLANTWLEYQYGWRPLVQDVYGAMDAYRDKIKVGMPVKASASNGVKLKGFNELKNDNSGQWTSGTSIRSSIKGDVANSGARTLQQLGLLNPASLAWNLLPYSFVADWFIPIGNILDSFTAGAGLTNLRQYTIIVERWETYCKNLGTWDTRSERITRTGMIGLLPWWGALRFSLPPLDTSRIANATALLNQRFR